ncbi:hypothetical protein ACXUPC_10770 [Pseudomonas marginalis]|jgi:hypothetical protein|uniref:hypothetical protein n=1 Tax=Pseudomonas marginalis TaxID=298 RepID=UPI0038B66F3F
MAYKNEIILLGKSNSTNSTAANKNSAIGIESVICAEPQRKQPPRSPAHNQTLCTIQGRY